MVQVVVARIFVCRAFVPRQMPQRFLFLFFCTLKVTSLDVDFVLRSSTYSTNRWLCFGDSDKQIIFVERKLLQPYVKHLLLKNGWCSDALNQSSHNMKERETCSNFARCSCKLDVNHYSHCSHVMQWMPCVSRTTQIGIRQWNLPPVIKQ